MDLEPIRAWGATAVVTLNPNKELVELGVPGLGQAVNEAGLAWYHLPIPDMASPDRRWDERWKAVAPEIHRSLYSDGRLVVHSKGGLGRAGTAGARALVERGIPPRDAVAWVRQVRPGAIETGAQERYLKQMAVGQYASALTVGDLRSH